MTLADGRKVGGDLFIVDDPIKAQDAVSEKARGAVNEWLGSTLASRAIDSVPE